MSLKNDIHSNSIEPMIAGFFTTTEIASIFLLSMALTFLLRSKQFITKRTLLQYLIISILQKISIVLVLILYSASSSSYSDNNPALYCIIQAYFSGFLEYGIAMIPAVLSIYLCFAILKNTDVERQVFVTMTSMIWLVAIIGTLAQIVGSLEQPSTGVRFNLDGCALTAGELGKWKLWSAVPILVFASVGLVFSVMSLYGLFSIWRRQIERTVLKSLYAVILMVACLILTLTRVILNLQSIHHLSDSHQNLWSANYALKFVLAVFGPILYTIYISLQTNTCLCIHFPCNTKETEDDDDLEEIVSWPSSLTLTDQQHGQQKTVDQEEGTAPMQKLELGKSFKESMVIVLR